MNEISRLEVSKTGLKRHEVALKIYVTTNQTNCKNIVKMAAWKLTKNHRNKPIGPTTLSKWPPENIGF